MSEQSSRKIVLLGGGRWGRVHASNCARLLTADDEILWVSQHKQAELISYAEGLMMPAAPSFSVVQTLDEALQRQPTAAIIVTLPETHASLAAKCLSHGLDVFVEKPLAFSASEADPLLTQAARSGRLLGVGIHLLSASYLRHFASLISARTIDRVEIRWLDPQTEIRYGEVKQNASTVPLVHDVYPHIWSIVRALTTAAVVEPLSASWGERGTVTFVGRGGDQQIVAHAGRRNHRRERRVTISFADGGSAELDFTSEPGVIHLDGKPAPQDPEWGTTPTPVMEEVRQFISLMRNRSASALWPHTASQCIDSVAGAEKFAALLFESTARQILQRAGEPTVAADTNDLAWDIVVNLAVASSAELATMSQPARTDAADKLLAAIAREASELRDCPSPQLLSRFRRMAADALAMRAD